MILRHPLFAAALTAVALAACGGDDDDDGSSGRSGSNLSQATVQSFEGVYELMGFTENESGCDVEGPSTLDSKLERSFVLVGSEAFGTRFMPLASCADANDCAATVDAIQNLGIYAPEYSLTLSTEQSPDELGGLMAGSGFLIDGVCTERDYEAHTLVRTGDDVRIESRWTALPDAPPEDGLCWARPAEQATEAKGLPCGRLQVIEGRKVGPLP